MKIDKYLSPEIDKNKGFIKTIRRKLYVTWLKYFSCKKKKIKKDDFTSSVRSLNDFKMINKNDYLKRRRNRVRSINYNEDSDIDIDYGNENIDFKKRILKSIMMKNLNNNEDDSDHDELDFKEKEKEDCVICTEELISYRKIVSCGHKFHL